MNAYDHQVAKGGNPVSEGWAQFYQILKQHISNNIANGKDDGEIGSILFIVNEGEVEGEPQKQVIVISTNASQLQNDSKSIGIGEVLLHVAQLLMEFVADPFISAVLLGRVLFNKQLQEESRGEEQESEEEHEDRPVPFQLVHQQLS